METHISKTLLNCLYTFFVIYSIFSSLFSFFLVYRNDKSYIDLHTNTLSIPLLQTLPNEKEKCILLLLYHTTVLLNIKVFTRYIYIYVCIQYMLELCDYRCNIHNWIYYRNKIFLRCLFYFFLSEVLKLFDHDNKNTDTKMCLIKKKIYFLFICFERGRGCNGRKKSCSLMFSCQFSPVTNQLSSVFQETLNYDHWLFIKPHSYCCYACQALDSGTRTPYMEVPL